MFIVNLYYSKKAFKMLLFKTAYRQTICFKKVQKWLLLHIHFCLKFSRQDLNIWYFRWYLNFYLCSYNNSQCNCQKFESKHGNVIFLFLQVPDVSLWEIVLCLLHLMGQYWHDSCLCIALEWPSSDVPYELGWRNIWRSRRPRHPWGYAITLRYFWARYWCSKPD